MFKLKAGWEHFWIYLFVVSLIFQSGSVKAALLGEGILFQVTRMLILIIPISLIFKYLNKKVIVSYMVTCLLIGALILVVNYILYPGGVFQLAYKIVIFTFSGGLYICLTNRGVNINEYIYRVIVILAAIALVFYFLTEMIKLPIPYSVVYNGKGYRYHNYYDIFFTYHYNQLLPRLSGLFWEPGAYQIYLNWGLFLYIFEKKENLKEFFVLIISILLTQSTSGYCIAAILIAIYMSKSRFFSKKSRWFVGIGGLACAFIISIFVIYNKIQTTVGDMYGSAFLRLSDITNGFKILIKHPLFGTGFGNETEFIALDLFGRGSSNGLISYAYMTGFFGLFVAFFPFFKNVRTAFDKKRQWMWILVVTIFNCTEPIYNLPVMAYILAVEYTHALKKVKQKIEE